MADTPLEAAAAFQTTATILRDVASNPDYFTIRKATHSLIKMARVFDKYPELDESKQIDGLIDTLSHHQVISFLPTRFMLFVLASLYDFRAKH